jgi:hypothetical protein
MMRDAAFIVAVICALSVIDHVFGKPVGLAVALTALIACLLFLYHAGANVPPPPSEETPDER